MVISSPPGSVIAHGDVKVIEGFGMPTRRGYPEYGDLFVAFKVKFPEPEFASPKQLQKLEALLPPREDVDMIDGDAEEVYMSDFDPDSYKNKVQQLVMFKFSS